MDKSYFSNNHINVSIIEIITAAFNDHITAALPYMVFVFFTMFISYLQEAMTPQIYPTLSILSLTPLPSK